MHLRIFRRYTFCRPGCRAFGLLLNFAADEASLAESDNPFAPVVRAHLKRLATRRDPASRHSWKIRLVKDLYNHGWSADNVRQLFRLIDWLMNLPLELQQSFRDEIYRFEKEKRMPYITSVERLALEEGRKKGHEEGREEGLKEALALGLEAKFGPAGTKLMPKIRALHDLAKLRALSRVLNTATRLDEVHRLPR